MKFKHFIKGFLLAMLFMFSTFALITPIIAGDTNNEAIAFRPPWEDTDPEPDPEPTGQQVPWGIDRVNAIDAAAAVDESGVVVAIIDTGIDYNHEDLQGIPLLWGWSYYSGYYMNARRYVVTSIDMECTPADFSPCYDDGDHGSHVAGTIAAQDNDIGVIGVAPDIGLYIFKALGGDGSGSYTAIANSIIKATQGPDGVAGTADDADVISMSLGGSVGTDELEAAVNFALSNGVVIVAATGNDGADTPSYPAAYPGVLKVGAMDINNVIASFSNRGEDVFAPGVAVLSTIPGDGYASWAGTSMATPHVSAIVALAIAAHPSYTNVQIFNLIVSTTDSYNMVNALGVV